MPLWLAPLCVSSLPPHLCVVPSPAKPVFFVAQKPPLGEANPSNIEFILVCPRLLLLLQYESNQAKCLKYRIVRQSNIPIIRPRKNQSDPATKGQLFPFMGTIGKPRLYNRGFIFSLPATVCVFSLPFPEHCAVFFVIFLVH
jgi:hypothetical protein